MMMCRGRTLFDKLPENEMIVKKKKKRLGPKGINKVEKKVTYVM